MAYQNPQPRLPDEKPDSFVHQENSIAEYTPIKNVYFAFIDVLGFKQTFDENREKPDSEFASAYKNAFQYYSLLMNSTRFSNSGNQWNSGQTSDSLYFYTDRPDYLASFIKIYSHFSLYAMSQKVFFRGGIAKGGLFVDKPHQFYGDSVIKAFLLESNIATYPRVVIDHNTFSDLNKEQSVSDFLIYKEPPERSYIKPFIDIPISELQSIVSVSGSELYRTGDKEWHYISDNIQRNLERFEFDNKNYQKYSFLLSEYSVFKASENEVQVQEIPQGVM